MNRLLFLFLLSIVGWTPLFGQDCFTEWDYYRPLELSFEGNSDTLTEIQVPIVLPTHEWVAATKLRSDGADLIISDSNCQIIFFYPDSAATSDSNVVWLKLDQVLPQEVVTLRVYYGNMDQTETAANGDSTFIFFEDGQGDTIETDKWEAIGEYDTWTESGGEMVYTSTGITASGSRFKFVRTKASFSDQVYVDFSVRQTNSSHYGFSSNLDTLERYVIRYNTGASDTAAIVANMGDSLSNGYATIVDYPWLVIPRFDYNALSIKASTTSDSTFVYEEIHNLTNGESNTDSLELDVFKFERFHFILTSFSANQQVGLKYLKIRKPLELPPVVTIGDEVFQGQTDGVFAPQLLQLHAYPNPVSGQLILPNLPEQSVSHYQLLNAAGQAIAKMNGSQTEWNLGNLPSGLYLLQALSDGQVIGTQRIVKE